ncbi:MAG: 4a-hydroxytetrahydrobiopterin dehydratase [Geminicoccaceae bacterium]|nr:4a-hydroxytetrahydrobiopterin dehydratase [Geminicoccaceae bacterium]
MDKLEASEVEAALRDLAGWSLGGDGGAIERSFRFKSFNAAFAFMTRAALLAEKMDHHPEWSNTYDRVEVRLTTHSAGGVTGNDLKMAKAMGRYATDVGLKG